ncbi:MAG: two-component system sensor histidine kinase NblS [Prochlorotrichaceae cyanobacterium]|jgi:two-component system sensor histidine kinase NblS
MLTLLQDWKLIIQRWWSEFTLQTKLMAAATLVVSLIMSGLTFWAVNSIQQDARFNDTRFGRDLGLLLEANVAPLLAEGNPQEVSEFSYRFYRSTSSIRYMLYADPDGQIFLTIPFSDFEEETEFSIDRRIQLPEGYIQNPDLPLVRQHQTPDGEVTDVFIPLIHKGVHLGVLAIGINRSPIAVTSSNLTRDVTIAVFISIWVMVILGAVFNALTITRPITELLLGVKNITSGNFKQRVDLPFGGELGELIYSFNEMAERLERYEAQNIEELTAEKAKLETLVSTIADGAILLDNQMQIILANSTARRIFNWEESDILGNSILNCLPLTVCNELSSPLASIVEEEHHREHQALVNTSDGESSGNEEEDLYRLPLEGSEFRITLLEPTKRTIRIMLTTVFDQHREHVKGVAITVQDITREAELNEAKGQFISNVSHELRTPLFNIKSFIETLHEFGDELNEEERREFLLTANSETDRLTRLVNDVLDLSRLESHRSYPLKPVDIAQAIEQTLRTYQLNARDKGIELCHYLDADLPSVLGHYDLLLQVFANLVGNALKFTKSGGVVVIRAYQLPQDHATRWGKVRIEISDTGIGIDPQDQEAIFDRFFRVENRVHTLEGTGLGLAIVRNIVDKHRSKVNLVSEVGVGTTFWIDLEACESNEV